MDDPRKAAGDKLEAIGMLYLPEGYTTKWRAALTGSCNYGKKLIESPKPRTRKSLYIFLHECAHGHLHDGSNKPKHVIELEAEQYAHAKMRDHDIPVPREMTTRAKRYVARKIGQAVKRGAKKINPDARKYAGKHIKNPW